MHHKGKQGAISMNVMIVDDEVLTRTNVKYIL